MFLPLLDGNLLDCIGLLGVLLLRDMDVQHSIFYLGFDLVSLGILRQQECLLELLVGEFAAEVLAVLLALLVLGLLLHFDVQVVVGVDVDLEVLLGESRCGEFHIVLFFVLNHIDGRSRVGRPFHPAVVEKVVENVRQPAIMRSSCR